jgi:ubiquinone/menaquinone biosynthesis C-methylase UbiE
VELERASTAAAERGVTHVEFYGAGAERLPLRDASVDLVATGS